jgi:hypothetical protein
MKQIFFPFSFIFSQTEASSYPTNSIGISSSHSAIHTAHKQAEAADDRESSGFINSLFYP